MEIGIGGSPLASPSREATNNGSSIPRLAVKIRIVVVWLTCSQRSRFDSARFRSLCFSPTEQIDAGANQQDR